MIPSAFEYYAPESLEEAITLLSKHGDQAKVLAGGHSIIPLMRFRFATPTHIIDINKIGDLDYIKESNGNLLIGALTREVELEQSELIKSKYPLLLDTTLTIGDRQIRNMATVGGNLAHGDPANDHPATMIAFGAEIVATGKDGERTIPVDDFFKGLLTTALKPDEILTEIRIPAAAKNSGGAYEKIKRKAGDFAVAAVAVQLTQDDSGKCTKAGIGLTNVGPMPIRASDAQKALEGKKIDDSVIAEAAAKASEACSPSSDLRGPKEYKVALIKELTKRAIGRALERTGGGS